MWYIHGYIYTMEYYSAIKKEIMPFAGTWMDPETTYKYQTEKDKYHITSLTCRIWKNDTNDFVYKTEIDTQT